MSLAQKTPYSDRRPAEPPSFEVSERSRGISERDASSAGIMSVLQLLAQPDNESLLSSYATLALESKGLPIGLNNLLVCMVAILKYISTPRAIQKFVNQRSEALKDPCEGVLILELLSSPEIDVMIDRTGSIVSDDVGVSIVQPDQVVEGNFQHRISYALGRWYKLLPQELEMLKNTAPQFFQLISSDSGAIKNDAILVIFPFDHQRQMTLLLRKN